MTTATPQPAMTLPHKPGFFRRTENWLDARGKPAWIAAMVLGFILFWPVGLALLGYMIWGKRMFGGNATLITPQSSGNVAFDSYKAQTLQRLEEEQAQFQDFLNRLREAKDKAEFDQFMQDRGEKAEASKDDPAAA